MAQQPIEKLSIAAPAYNEIQGIRSIVETWHKYLKNDSSLLSFEIVICDDGSKDGTGDLLDQLALQFPQLKVIHHKKNKGAAAALSTAIHHATGQWVLLLDCDGQFPVENLEYFRKKLVEEPSYAYIGVRLQKKDSLFARFGSWSSGIVCNLCFRTKYRDFNSACKLVDGKVLRWLSLEAKGLNYSTDITAKLIESGFAPLEVIITHEKRQQGKSHRTLIRGALHRLLFVKYLILRQILFSLKVLQRPSEMEDRPYG
ncbi:MAG: glycosyltransferase family 2 protein [Candidatus Omnitrophota bacterium]